MTPIGGYFELDLPRGEHFHKTAYRFNSARNCLECILLSRGYKKIYLPYFTCDVILQPIQRQGIKYEFYRITTSLDPMDYPRLKDDEAFLYTNYYGVKQATIVGLIERYGNHLIVDNAQAFYSSRQEGIDTFYSPRKFFGVPDGGYLYMDLPLNERWEREDSSWSRSSHLLRRIDQGPEKGYDDYRRAEESLNCSPIRMMSRMTELLLKSIDYSSSALKRKCNFHVLNESLGKNNPILPDLINGEVPMVYPYYTRRGPHLRTALLSNRIYVAKYWENVQKWCSSGVEYEYVDNLIPLPIDQRLSIEDMMYIVDIIRENE